MKKTLLTSLCGVLIGLLFTFFKGTTIMLGAITITGMILWNFLPGDDRGFLIRLFIAGILVRMIILAFFYLISISYGDYGEFTPDSRLYFLKSLDMVRSWKEQIQFSTQVQEEVGRTGWLYILSFFYLLIGYNPDFLNPVSMYSDKLINCLIGTFSGIPIFYLAKDIFGKKTAKLSALLAVFWPTLMLWSMTNSRDSVNILLVCLIVFSLVRLLSRKSFGYFILFFFTLLLLKTIRSYMFFCVLTAVALSLLIMPWKKIKKRSFLLSIFTILFIFLNLTSYGRGLKNTFLNFNNITNRLYIANEGIVLEGKNNYIIYDEDFLLVNEKERLFKLARTFFKGWFYFMLVPFPWTLFSISQLFSYPQIIIWYFLLPFIFIGILFALRYRRKVSLIVILSYLFITTSAYAFVEGNTGSALRHRDLVLIFYLIFGSAGIIKVFVSDILTDQKDQEAYNEKI